MTITIPDTARCRTCGYLLRGLVEPACPECGRAFDPQDPKSFDLDFERRRRLWAKRVAVALSVAALLFFGFPRRLLRGTITFTCGQCGEQHLVKRWEPVPPRWIPWRYFGIARRSHTAGTAEGPETVEHEHTYSLAVSADLHLGGAITGMLSPPDPGKVIVFGGNEATVANARTVLEFMMSRANRGFVPSVVSLPDDESPRPP